MVEGCKPHETFYFPAIKAFILSDQHGPWNWSNVGPQWPMIVKYHTSFHCLGISLWMLTVKFSTHTGAWQLTRGSPRCKVRWWTHRTRLRDQRCQGPWHAMVTPVTKERLVILWFQWKKLPKILDHKMAPKCNKTQRTQRYKNQNFRCWSPRPQVRRVHQAAAPRSNGWGMCIARGKQLSRAFDDEMGLWSLWAIPQPQFKSWVIRMSTTSFAPDLNLH